MKPRSLRIVLAVLVTLVAPTVAALAQDCDANGVPDAIDLCAGAADADGDRCLDSCEHAHGNFDLDGEVDGADLATLLGQWGEAGAALGDLDGNGVVDAADLAALLAHWGPVSYGGPGGPAWATVLSWCPDAAIVTNEPLRSAIVATGLPWRVRDAGTGIEMLLVPPGTFAMGCSSGSMAYPCFDWELPVHQVTLTTAYYIGRYEVTQSQWTARMGSNPSAQQGPEHPVTNVSWNTIQGFLTATGLRLPTEAEWEYSCRAGTTTPFHSGPGFADGTTDDSLVAQIAWHWPGSGGNTNVVGGKAGNALGLHDMLGNVWEVVPDWYSYYGAASQVNPVGPSSGWGRVLRGGSLDLPTANVRSSHRAHLETAYSGYSNFGFRVAKNP